MCEDTLLEHDQYFFQALMDADTARLETLLAEDFVLVGVEDGAVAGKAALL